jgi:hypothetical protein
VGERQWAELRTRLDKRLKMWHGQVNAGIQRKSVAEELRGATEMLFALNHMTRIRQNAVRSRRRHTGKG